MPFKGYWQGKHHSEETKKKISETLKAKGICPPSRLGTHLSEEHKQRISEANKGNTYRLGHKLSAETRRKMSENHVGMTGKHHSEETRKKISETKRANPCRYWLGKKHSEERRRRNSEVHIGLQTGSNNPAWRGGVSFGSYCPKFNFAKKEEIRNRDHRNCRVCGKGEIQNGKRLSVHHIDGDKAGQGCGKKWYLAALCMSCSSKATSKQDLYEFLIVSNRG